MCNALKIKYNNWFNGKDMNTLTHVHCGLAMLAVLASKVRKRKTSCVREIKLNYFCFSLKKFFYVVRRNVFIIKRERKNRDPQA